MSQGKRYSHFRCIGENRTRVIKGCSRSPNLRALEACLKKYAESHGLSPDDKDSSDVIGHLKANQLLLTPKSKVVRSHVTLREHAFHAEWEKLSQPEVGGLIADLDGYILSRFIEQSSN